jgi:hypothetical protein
MTSRRRPHYTLKAIKAAFSDVSRLNRTMTAVEPIVDDRELYVKFTLDARGQLLLISFKENEP